MGGWVGLHLWWSQEEEWNGVGAVLMNIMQCIVSSVNEVAMILLIRLMSGASIRLYQC